MLHHRNSIVRKETRHIISFSAAHMQRKMDSCFYAQKIRKLGYYALIFLLGSNGLNNILNVTYILVIICICVRSDAILLQ